GCRSPGRAASRRTRSCATAAGRRADARAEAPARKPRAVALARDAATLARVPIEPRPLTFRERVRALAAPHYRRLLRARPFVGVTGSVAKSTTVKLAGDVLGALGPGFVHPLGGNAGPHIPRLLFTVRPRDRFAVFELSGHQPGALDDPIATVRPTVGVVTWVGMDHWKSFPDPGGIAREKGKLVERLPGDGCAVLNADDPAVAAMAARTRARVLTYGL